MLDYINLQGNNIYHKLRHAAKIIQKGGVVAYPTEGVFGLGCDPLNFESVSRILALKQRNPQKGLILIAHHWDAFKPFINPTCLQKWQELQSEIQPEPCTWVLPASFYVPDWLMGEHSSIAIRVTKHPIAHALCKAVGFPIVSTSANKSGQAPLREAQSVRFRFKTKVDFILTGKTGTLGKPTPIRDGLSGNLIRA